MRLNDLKPGPGSRQPRKRAGRGASSGLGKTAGRGQKGQKSRSGGKAPVGFEGGQMPLQRRLPKFGFSSRKARWNAEVRIDALVRLDAEVIDLDVLKAAKVVAKRVQRAKVILAGQLDRAVRLRGLSVTKGARAAIESAGGSIEE